MAGKTARACDGCLRRRARWYCTADDAFLCQSCDALVHSANQVASRHDRVPLRTSSSSSSELKTSRTTVWYEGFTRKARTTRNTKGNNSDDDDAFNSNNLLVPDLGSEEVPTFSLSFSSMNENEENSNYCVPVFDPFSENDAVKYENVGENSSGCVPNGCNNKPEGDRYEKMDDGLDGSLPLDVDLVEFAMDVENLLGEECCRDVKEQLGFLEFKEEYIDVNDINNLTLNGVKNEEEEDEEWASGLKSDYRRRGREGEEERVDIDGEYCCKDEETLKRTNYKIMFLRLDYEAVITAWDNHGSPWTAGCRPEFSPGDSWPDCVLQGHMCPRQVLSGSEETTAVGSMPRHQQGRHTVSDGEREARVLRYKEKRRTRLFEKKIRYEVRKLNAEQRPRIKGRFVKRTSLLGTL